VSDSSLKSSSPKLRFGRFLLIVILFSIACPIVMSSLAPLVGFPKEWVPGVYCGLLMLLFALINWMARTGRAPWLVKNDDA